MSSPHIGGLQDDGEGYGGGEEREEEGLFSGEAEHQTFSVVSSSLLTESVNGNVELTD